MNLLNEEVKFDMGLVPQTLNNSNATGQYFSMRDFRRACAVSTAGAAAATKTTKVEFLQATDAAGTGAKAMTVAKEKTVTANTDVLELTVALASVLSGDAITINGLVFTADVSTNYATRKFSISGTDTQDADELLACILHETYGCPGLTGSNATGTLTLKAARPGEVLVSASSLAATFTIATTKHFAYVELDGYDLDKANGFQWVACKVTTTGNTPVSVALLRYGAHEVSIDNLQA